MPERTATPVLPRPRQAPAGDWNGPGGGFLATRYDTRRDGFGVRLTSTVLVAIVLIAAGVVVVGAKVGPGLAILAVGVGVSMVLAGLNSPRVAIVMLVVTLFMRIGLKIDALPAEPYLFAFGGVLLSAGVALTRRVSQAPRFGPVEGFMALFVLWEIFSAVLPHDLGVGEENPVHYFILLGTFVPFAMYVVGHAVVDSEKTIRVLLWTIVGCFAYSVMHSIAQFHFKPLAWPHTVAGLGESASWAHRALGVFGNPVENGFVLLVGYLVTLYLVRTPGTMRPVVKAGLHVLLVAALYAVYLTYTRASQGTFVLALVAGVLWMPRVRSYCLVVLGVGTLGALANLSTLTSTDRQAGGLASAYEIQDRENMIATAWWAIKQNPIVGWGITRFAKVNTYHHKQWSPLVPWTRGYGIKAHVNELGIWTELGLIGLLLWFAVLTFVVAALRRAIRALPRGTQVFAGRELAIMCATFAFLWFVTGLTVDLRYLSFGNCLAWLLAGVAVGVGQRALSAGTQLPARPPEQEHAVYLDEDEELYLRWVAAQ